MAIATDGADGETEHDSDADSATPSDDGVVTKAGGLTDDERRARNRRYARDHRRRLKCKIALMTEALKMLHFQHDWMLSLFRSLTTGQNPTAGDESTSLHSSASLHSPMADIRGLDLTASGPGTGTSVLRHRSVSGEALVNPFAAHGASPQMEQRLHPPMPTQASYQQAMRGTAPSLAPHMSFRQLPQMQSSQSPPTWPVHLSPMLPDRSPGGGIPTDLIRGLQELLRSSPPAPAARLPSLPLGHSPFHQSIGSLPVSSPLWTSNQPPHYGYQHSPMQTHVGHPYSSLPPQHRRYMPWSQPAQSAVFVDPFSAAAEAAQRRVHARAGQMDSGVRERSRRAVSDLMAAVALAPTSAAAPAPAPAHTPGPAPTFARAPATRSGPHDGETDQLRMTLEVLQQLTPEQYAHLPEDWRQLLQGSLAAKRPTPSTTDRTDTASALELLASTATARPAMRMPSMGDSPRQGGSISVFGSNAHRSTSASSRSSDTSIIEAQLGQLTRIRPAAVDPSLVPAFPAPTVSGSSSSSPRIAFKRKLGSGQHMGHGTTSGDGGRTPVHVGSPLITARIGLGSGTTPGQRTQPACQGGVTFEPMIPQPTSTGKLAGGSAPTAKRRKDSGASQETWETSPMTGTSTAITSVGQSPAADRRTLPPTSEITSETKDMTAGSTGNTAGQVGVSFTSPHCPVSDSSS